jgi:hypothetical protein
MTFGIRPASPPTFKRPSSPMRTLSRMLAVLSFILSSYHTFLIRYPSCIRR